uniref:phosphatase PAP2 family protein n=1 Tax=Nocardia donostiensis TaxID=1538463 RepID=UPI001FED0F06|nr:phosphatase PAP2 family protein [Nocardia donostiensis]
MITDPAASDDTEPDRTTGNDDDVASAGPHPGAATADTFAPWSSVTHRVQPDRPAQPARLGRLSGAAPSPATLSGLVVGGAAVTAAVPTTFPADGDATEFDQVVRGPVNAALDPRPWIAEVFALASNTWVVFALLLSGAAWFAWQRRWWETGTMVVVPEVAVSINTWVLKPWWGRPLHDYLAYPSGHTVHLIAVATTFLLLIESARARIVLVLLTVFAWTVAGVGMVALDYHLPTDVVGGAGAAVALSAGLYWVFAAGHRGLAGSRRI